MSKKDQINKFEELKNNGVVKEHHRKFDAVVENDRNKPATDEQIAELNELIAENYIYDLTPERWKTLTKSEADRVIKLGQSRKKREAKVLQAKDI